MSKYIKIHPDLLGDLMRSSRPHSRNGGLLIRGETYFKGNGREGSKKSGDGRGRIPQSQDE